MANCPDNDAKRLARYYLYRRARNLWASGGKPDGSALVLAGDEASEIGCLRTYLGLPPNKVYFVDKDAEGLEVVKNEWPRAQTFHGQIEDAIASLREDVGFVNLDFCGYVSDKTFPSVTASAKKLQPKGILAYTFPRDRESLLTPNWEAAQLVTNEIASRDPRFRSIDKSSSEWKDTVRFVGYTAFLTTTLGKGFVPIFLLRYRNEDKRHMGILAFQNMPPSMRTPAWRKELDLYRSHEERIGVVSNVDIRTRLRDIAMELTDTISSKEVASILHLPKSTMAAWQAHKTRGTYRAKESEEWEAG